MRATTEAMVKLLGLANGKRGGFFVVERTTGYVVGARLFERYVTLDHVHDIETIKQILNEAFWNHASTALSLRSALNQGMVIWVRSEMDFEI